MLDALEAEKKRMSDALYEEASAHWKGEIDKQQPSKKKAKVAPKGESLSARCSRRSWTINRALFCFLSRSSRRSMKRSSAAARATASKKTRKEEILLRFRVLSADAFACVADALYYAEGGRALAALLEAMAEPDRECEKMATNYAAKFAARMKWRSPDLSDRPSKLREARRLVVERLRTHGSALTYCLFCGTRKEDASMAFIHAHVASALGVSFMLRGCRECWIARYPRELILIPSCECRYPTSYADAIQNSACGTCALRRVASLYRGTVVLRGDPENASAILRELAQLLAPETENGADFLWFHWALCNGLAKEWRRCGATPTERIARFFKRVEEATRTLGQSPQQEKAMRWIACARQRALARIEASEKR